MAVTRTFSIIKPDATRRNLTGAITKMLEDAGPSSHRVQAHPHDPRPGRGLLCRPQRAAVLQRPCDFMTSGPVVVQVLEGEDAVKRNRDVMGATNPADAAEGTIRKAYAESIEANSVHGRTATRTRRSRSTSSSAPTKSSARTRRERGQSIGLSVASRFCQSRRRNAVALDVRSRDHDRTLAR